MRARHFFLLLAGLKLIPLAASVPFYDRPPAFNVHFTGGYRQDTLKYHIQKDRPLLKDCSCSDEKSHKKHRHKPQNFAKVTFNDLQMAQIGAIVNYSTFCHNYYMRANGDYANLTHGTARVSSRFLHHPHASRENDYDSQNPDQHSLLEISQQKGKINDGYAYDFAGGVGWKVTSNDSRTWVAGVVGYSYERQNVKVKHFRQTRDSLNIIAHNCLNKLHANYETQWSGPWFGVDFSAMVECNVTFFGSAEWHLANFQSGGKWRIPNIFHGKFHQSAQGYGVVGTLGFDWAPTDRWAIGVIGNYQQWSTRKGKNHGSKRSFLPLNDPLEETLPIARRSRMFRTKWYSYSVSLLTSYRF